MPRAILASGSRAALCALLAGAALLATRGARARDVEDWLADGDRWYAQANLAEAQRAYAAAVQMAPMNLGALCRLACAESELAELQGGDTQRRTRASAVEHARAAIRLAPDSAAGHVWLAVALGRQALSEGPKTKLAMAREVKSEAERALALDPGLGRAWHVIAVWNVQLSELNAFERMAANAVLGGLPRGASYDNAEAAFRKAIALEPAYVHHRLEYGRFLHDRHRDAEARVELEKAIELPPTSDALDARYQTEARTLLGKLRK